MLIVTGLGRCGTTAIMKFLKEIGLNLGKVSYSKIMRAGYEDRHVYMINVHLHDLIKDLEKEGRDFDAEYLADQRSLKYQNIPETKWSAKTFRDRILYVGRERKLEGEDKQFEWLTRMNAVKGPRFTWHPMLIKVWKESRDDLGVLLCHRKIEDIYKSRLKLSGGGMDPKRNTNFELFKTDFADFFTALLETGLPYRTLFYPDFLFNYREVETKLGELGVYVPPGGRQKWEATIHPEMVSRFDKKGCE